MTLDEVKEQRPECITEDGEHTWVNYESTGTRECEDCHYVEDIIYPLEY